MTLLEQIREATGLKRWRVAAYIRMDQTGLKKVEQGRSRPTVETAEVLYEFFGGIVPIGIVFHSEHYSHAGWLTDARRKQLERRGRELEKEFPGYFPPRG